MGNVQSLSELVSGLAKQPSPVFTRHDLERMDRDGRIILLLGKKVYDVTNFTDHPGGQGSLKRNRMKQNKVNFGHHSKQGKRLWNDFFIGFVSD